PEVRMSDPHPICIQQAMIAMQQDMQRYLDIGMPPPDYANIQEYIQLHEGMFQQQQIMMAQQAMMAGAPPEQGPQGKPKQGRADGGPGDEIGGAKQTGQAVGVGNK